MTVRGTPAPALYLPLAYWEDRARRFAREGEGLAAVCSYGMPAFCNWVIDACQGRALKPWLRVKPGARVLDVGCGVGRWSRRLARRGAHVTGIDLSPTMITEARRRAEDEGVLARCRFETQNLAELDAGARFDLVLGVTVLQHILDRPALEAAVMRMTGHLAPGGRMVLLEASPRRVARHCDTTVFRARPRSEYLGLFERCGLAVRALNGVDPAPFRYMLLPYLERMPRSLGLAATVLASAVSLPVDGSFGRHLPGWSWHTVFVLGHASGGGGRHA